MISIKRLADVPNDEAIRLLWYYDCTLTKEMIWIEYNDWTAQYDSPVMLSAGLCDKSETMPNYIEQWAYLINNVDTEPIVCFGEPLPLVPDKQTIIVFEPTETPQSVILEYFVECPTEQQIWQSIYNEMQFETDEEVFNPIYQSDKIAFENSDYLSAIGVIGSQSLNTANQSYLKLVRRKFATNTDRPLIIDFTKLLGTKIGIGSINVITSAPYSSNIPNKFFYAPNIDNILLRLNPPLATVDLPIAESYDFTFRPPYVLGINHSDDEGIYHAGSSLTDFLGTSLGDSIPIAIDIAWSPSRWVLDNTFTGLQGFSRQLTNLNVNQSLTRNKYPAKSVTVIDNLGIKSFSGNSFLFPVPTDFASNLGDTLPQRPDETQDGVVTSNLTRREDLDPNPAVEEFKMWSYDCVTSYDIEGFNFIQSIIETSFYYHYTTEVNPIGTQWIYRWFWYIDNGNATRSTFWFDVNYPQKNLVTYTAYLNSALLTAGDVQQLYQDKDNFLEILPNMVFFEQIDAIYNCLGAEESAYLEDNSPVVMNLARKVDLICKFLGLSFNFDGSYQISQSTRYFDAGENLPQGWYVSQTGLTRGWQPESKTPEEVNLGNLPIEEQRIGLLYDVISNKIVGNEDGTKNIVDGGYVACNNFPQYLRQVLDDVDKMLGGQYLGAGAINRNGRTFVYEGLVNLLQELFASAIDTGASTEETKIAVGVNQQLMKELMRGLGLPVATKTFEYELESRDPQSEEIDPLDPPVGAVPVYYSGYAEGTPTLADLIFAVLANIGLNNASAFTLKQSQQENIEEQVNK